MPNVFCGPLHRRTKWITAYSEQQNNHYAAITCYLPALGLMPYNLARIKLLQLNSML